MAQVVGRAVHKQYTSSFLPLFLLCIPSTSLAHRYLCLFEVLRRSFFVHLPLIRSAGPALAFASIITVSMYSKFILGTAALSSVALAQFGDLPIPSEDAQGLESLVQGVIPTEYKSLIPSVRLS